MEKLGPLETFKRYVEDLECPRQWENIGRFKYIPTLDQHLTLAVNQAETKKTRYFGKDGILNTGAIIDDLKTRLISVSTSSSTPDDPKEDVVLGLFFTNVSPFDTYPRVVLGIFPLSDKNAEYRIRSRDYFESGGKIQITNESLTGKDPFLAENTNTKGLNFLFFKKNPFSTEHPYQVAPTSDYSGIKPIQAFALEENIISSAMWHVENGKRSKLFEQAGFNRFIKSHSSDPEYAELYKAFIKRR